MIQRRRCRINKQSVWQEPWKYRSGPRLQLLIPSDKTKLSISHYRPQQRRPSRSTLSLKGNPSLMKDYRVNSPWSNWMNWWRAYIQTWWPRCSLVRSASRKSRHFSLCSRTLASKYLTLQKSLPTRARDRRLSKSLKKNSQFKVTCRHASISCSCWRRLLARKSRAPLSRNKRSFKR